MIGFGIEMEIRTRYAGAGEYHGFLVGSLAFGKLDTLPISERHDPKH